MICKDGKTDCKSTALFIVTNTKDPTENPYTLCKIHLETEVDGVKIYKVPEMKIEPLKK